MNNYAVPNVRRIFLFLMMMITDQNFGPPLNLQVDRVTSHSFRVTWSEPSVHYMYKTTVRIDNYEVRVFQGNGTILISSDNIDPAEYEQEGSLHPNSRYRIEVWATVARVPGPIADCIVQTSEDGEQD